MFNKLIALRDKGYYPDTILDIGAYHGVWTDSVKMIYSKSEYHLFEAIDYDELKKFKPDPKVKIYNVILNEKEEDVNWYQMKNTGDSIFREQTRHFSKCEIIKRKSIDLNTIISKNNILQESKNILIKIDCQGAEIPILKGATSILEKTDFIILELPMFGQYNEDVPTFLEHIMFMDNIGFIPYEILEASYEYGFNIQIDMLFINKKHEFNQLIKTILL
jgi:FkbM family methyltransferase